MQMLPFLQSFSPAAALHKVVVLCKMGRYDRAAGAKSWGDEGEMWENLP